MQFITEIHARTPRVSCPRHGKKADDFACVMTDIDGRRILDVGRGRSEEGARQLVERSLNPVRRHLVRGAAIDMSAPFEKAMRELVMLPVSTKIFEVPI